MFLLSSGYGHCHCHCTVTLYPGAAPAAGQTRPKNYIAISYFRHVLLSVVEAVDHAVNAETPRIFISISYFRVDLTLGRPPVGIPIGLEEKMTREGQGALFDLGILCGNSQFPICISQYSIFSILRKFRKPKWNC